MKVSPGFDHGSAKRADESKKREEKIEGYDESTVIDMYKHPNDYR